jgi:hypothetical protein
MGYHAIPTVLQNMHMGCATLTPSHLDNQQNSGFKQMHTNSPTSHGIKKLEVPNNQDYKNSYGNQKMTK